MTQLDLAVAAGLSEKYVSKLERGIYAASVDSLSALAKALKIKVSDLFRDADD